MYIYIYGAASYPPWGVEVKDSSPRGVGVVYSIVVVYMVYTVYILSVYIVYI